MPIYQIKLIERQVIAQQTIVCHFEKPSGFSFKPGQYGGFTLINPIGMSPQESTRRFSFASAPHDPFLALATRLQDSPYKQALNQLLIGETMKLAGPTGNFILPEDESIPVVLIAGGIGITPFYSMIHDAIYRQSKRLIILIYGNETALDAPFLQTLQMLSKNTSSFHCIATLSKPTPDWTGETGWISYQLIKKSVPNLLTSHYYLCGSLHMVNALHETLNELAIPESQIKIEDFPGY